MSNIEKIKPNELAEKIATTDLGTLIQPLTKEIYLFETTVAGTTHIDDQAIFDTLKVNDKLHLLREDNQYDKKAIMLLTENKKKIGYVPKDDNIIFSRLMDAGKLLIARIKSLDKKGSWNILNINIYLIDF